MNYPNITQSVHEGRQTVTTTSDTKPRLKQPHCIVTQKTADTKTTCIATNNKPSGKTPQASCTQKSKAESNF